MTLLLKIIITSQIIMQQKYLFTGATKCLLFSYYEFSLINLL